MITVFANLKGGSGKSTVSFNMAAWLEDQGCSVMAIDLDPQRTLTDVAEVRVDEGVEPVLQVYAQDEPQVVKTDVDEVIIDVGAANPAGMNKALRMADRIVIPVPPSQPDVWATQRFLKMVKEAREDLDTDIEILAFLNRADTHHAVRESDDAQAALEMVKGISYLPQRLYSRTIYRRSMSEGLAVFEFWHGSKAADEFEALACALYPNIAAGAENE